MQTVIFPEKSNLDEAQDNNYKKNNSEYVQGPEKAYNLMP